MITVKIIQDIYEFYIVRECNENGEIFGLPLSDGFTDFNECLKIISDNNWVLFV